MKTRLYRYVSEIVTQSFDSRIDDSDSITRLLHRAFRYTPDWATIWTGNGTTIDGYTMDYKRDKNFTMLYNHTFLFWVYNLKACDLRGVFNDHQIVELLEEETDEP